MVGEEELQIFADRIKELRKSLNLTQAQFVEDLGITPSSLSAYEQNTKNPSISVAIRIAKKYKVSIDWLCGLSDQKTAEGDIETYGDIIRLLIKIEKRIDISLIEKQHNLVGNELITREGLIFYNEQLKQFIEEWDKMKRLHDDETIDDEVYDLWVEKTLKKYDGIKLERKLPPECLPFT